MESGFMLIVYVVGLFLILGVIGYIISLFNSLIQVRNNIGKAWSNIDVLLIQRNEEIPKLIDITKAYGEYEREIMEEIAYLRTKYSQVRRSEQKTDIENQLSIKLRQILAAGERYPDIKSNLLYENVRERISGLEKMIADRRAFFNDTVTIYNTQRETFPHLVFARLLGFRQHPLLDIPKNEKL
jgi:LemA protein